MSIKKTCILSFLCFGVWLLSFQVPLAGEVPPANEGTLSLDRVVSLCLHNNLDVRVAQEKVLGQLAQVRKAGAERLPSATITGMYTRIGVVPTFEIPGYEEIKFVNPNMVNLSMTVDYPLLDWGMAKDQVAIERLGLKSQELNAVLQKKAFIRQLSLLYFNILQVQESQGVVKENMALIEDILVILRRQYAAALIPEHQILQTEVALETLKSQQLDLDRARTEMMITLKNVCGLPLGQEVVLEKLEKKGDFLAVPRSSLLEKASLGREEFEVLRLQLDILEKTRGIIAKTRLPLVATAFKAELKNGIMPDVDKLKTNWNIGLTVIYNLFDGQATRFEQETLRHEIAGLRLSQERLERDVQANLEKLLDHLQRLEQRLVIEKKRLSLAQKSLDLARESFKESQATYLEVLNAQSNYNLAESSVVALAYQEFMQIVHLEFELYPLSYFLSREEK